MSQPKFKDSPVEVDQHLLFPTNIFDLLPTDHDCFVYESLFQSIDTSEVEKKYHHLGQHAYPPKLIVSILIYAYSHGVFSSRQIERRCRQDLAFMYISKMNCPNFRVLGDFRKDNLSFFHDCFKHSVKLAMELRMASLGHISLDGSKFKASSSKHKAMSYGRLKSREAELSAEIDELIKKASLSDQQEDDTYKEANGYTIPEDLQFKQERLKKIKAAKEALEKREKALNPDEQIDDKKQISFADHDARIMSKKGYCQYSYNAQISVDGDHQIIVGQHLSKQANDIQEVEPALNALSEATGGAMVDKMSMDNGYFSGLNLHAVEQRNIDGYIATDRGEKPAEEALENSDRKFVKADFAYDAEADVFVCPANERLVTNPLSKAKRKSYRASKEVCSDCPYRSRCSGANKEPGRVIRTDRFESARQAMNKKMESTEAKSVYERRKVIAEPAFGQIKNSGFRGFSLRGKEKVAAEFSLVCTAHNIKKFVKAATTGSIRLDGVKKVKKAA
ncbi:IS1182 family transposase [Thalassotalea sp. G20_0]|uniref:IS1182 family transposase n=1 Tax=Thalassotalea sp. G20_0 TaxID=2821093 RepID=UPI001ADB2941|nr:IS1182 family transposase [Thalassotalea sp. G20_0]MBO9496676.1 IS1182 family transposase [Thalassotalea sp. G20_0]